MAILPYLFSMKDVQWMGNSLKVLREFSDAVKQGVGYALYMAQHGETAPQAKRMKGLGGGVYEIVEDHDTDTYRAVYIARLKTGIYVLHAFQKKSTRGVKTSQRDVELIGRRLKAAEAMDKKLIKERG